LNVGEFAAGLKPRPSWIAKAMRVFEAEAKTLTFRIAMARARSCGCAGWLLPRRNTDSHLLNEGRGCRRLYAVCDAAWRFLRRNGAWTPRAKESGGELQDQGAKPDVTYPG